MKPTLLHSFLMHAVVWPLAVCGVAALGQEALAQKSAPPKLQALGPIDACVGKPIGSQVAFKDRKGNSTIGVCVLSAMPSTEILRMANDHKD